MSMEQENQLNIEITDDVSGGVYSNLAIISHSETEFVVDFIQVMPGVPKAKVKSRIILNPQHAKRLLMALKDNIDKYEATFGTIPINQNIPNRIPFNPKGQA